MLNYDIGTIKHSKEACIVLTMYCITYYSLSIFSTYLFQSNIKEVILSTQKDHTHALMVIDIDKFKQVNDTYGHAFADRELMEITENIKLNFRDSDVLGRIGGDEFIVFIEDII